MTATDIMADGITEVGIMTGIVAGTAITTSAITKR
ncbi:MAG: hypothetical protein JWO15_3006 [Sphingomonadales bacterium]|nr:hypothetical protein [Sphingomonadales bacterium]